MFKRMLSLTVIVSFFLTTLSPIPKAHADALGLPAPGTMVNLSPTYEPVIIKGLTVHKDNPFLFDFIVDIGQDRMSGEPLKKEGEKLIKYFLASLAIPDKDVWVNLSPYEKDKMIPEALGQTDMGRDLLEQDYILKQITSSLIYPEKQLGKIFWDKVYAKAQAMYGTTQIPVNTFNKVWIMADRAEVFEHNQTAFVVDQHLKVMLEEDYLALQKHSVSKKSISKKNNVILSEAKDLNSLRDIHTLGSQIVREIVLPELEKEVNNGKNFANLRQIFNSIILSSWYKKNLQQALLNQVYADKSKVKGIDLNDPTIKQQIYEQYLKAYKKGVFNYIKEDMVNGQTTPRKYFSGGLAIENTPAAAPAVITDLAEGDRAMRTALPQGPGRLEDISAGFNLNAALAGQRPHESNAAMRARLVPVGMERIHGIDVNQVDAINALVVMYQFIARQSNDMMVQQFDRKRGIAVWQGDPRRSKYYPIIQLFLKDFSDQQIVGGGIGYAILSATHETGLNHRLGLRYAVNLKSPQSWFLSVPANKFNWTLKQIAIFIKNKIAIRLKKLGVLIEIAPGSGDVKFVDAVQHKKIAPVKDEYASDAAMMGVGQVSLTDFGYKVTDALSRRVDLTDRYFSQIIKSGDKRTVNYATMRLAFTKNNTNFLSQIGGPVNEQTAAKNLLTNAFRRDDLGTDVLYIAQLAAHHQGFKKGNIRPEMFWSGDVSYYFPDADKQDKADPKKTAEMLLGKLAKITAGMTLSVDVIQESLYQLNAQDLLDINLQQLTAGFKEEMVKLFPNHYEELVVKLGLVKSEEDKKLAGALLWKIFEAYNDHTVLYEDLLGPDQTGDQVMKLRRLILVALLHLGIDNIPLKKFDRYDTAEDDYREFLYNGFSGVRGLIDNKEKFGLANFMRQQRTIELILSGHYHAKEMLLRQFEMLEREKPHDGYDDLLITTFIGLLHYDKPETYWSKIYPGLSLANFHTIPVPIGSDLHQALFGSDPQAASFAAIKLAFTKAQPPILYPTLEDQRTDAKSILNSGGGNFEIRKFPTVVLIPLALYHLGIQPEDMERLMFDKRVPYYFPTLDYSKDPLASYIRKGISSPKQMANALLNKLEFDSQSTNREMFGVDESERVPFDVIQNSLYVMNAQDVLDIDMQALVHGHSYENIANRSPQSIQRFVIKLGLARTEEDKKEAIRILKDLLEHDLSYTPIKNDRFFRYYDNSADVIRRMIQVALYHLGATLELKSYGEESAIERYRRLLNRPWQRTRSFASSEHATYSWRQKFTIELGLSGKPGAREILLEQLKRLETEKPTEGYYDLLISTFFALLNIDKKAQNATDAAMLSKLVEYQDLLVKEFNRVDKEIREAEQKGTQRHILSSYDYNIYYRINLKRALSGTKKFIDVLRTGRVSIQDIKAFINDGLIYFTWLKAHLPNAELEKMIEAFKKELLEYKFTYTDAAMVANAQLPISLEEFHRVVEIVIGLDYEQSEFGKTAVRIKKIKIKNWLDDLGVYLLRVQSMGDPRLAHVAEEAHRITDLLNQQNDAAMAGERKATTPGGIDLNTSSGMQWKVSKDGKGVEMNIDPAMLARIKKQGIESLSPVIFRITPVTNVWPLMGLQAPEAHTQLAKL